MRTVLRALGLMSGTSLDGVDIALIETDGERVYAQGPAASRPYDESERHVLRQALEVAKGLNSRDARPPALVQAENLITKAHAEAVEQFMQTHRLAMEEIDLVGFHGQTVIHRPEQRLTVQIGDGAALARRLGLPVVYDMRAADVAAGGQGAPLVPVYHRALVLAQDMALPVAVLNIGGVGNATVIGPAGELIACDTGPGGALLDDFMLERTGIAMDEDGLMAAQGCIHESIIRDWLAHPFFALPPPKSLDRNAFSRKAVEHLSTPDGAATLTAFTAASVARLVDHLHVAPRLWILCGGGAKNPMLRHFLQERLARPITMADDFGWSVDAMEAQAFAFLAVRSLRGLPLSFPGTTGVPEPLTGGLLARP